MTIGAPGIWYLQRVTMDRSSAKQFSNNIGRLCKELALNLAPLYDWDRERGNIRTLQHSTCFQPGTADHSKEPELKGALQSIGKTINDHISSMTLLVHDRTAMILRPPTLAYPGLLQKRVLTIRESWKLSKELRHSHECPWIFQPHSTTRGDLDDFMRLCTLQIHRQLWLIFPCGQTLCRCECMICHYIVKKSFVGNLRFNAVRWRSCDLPVVYSYDLQ